MSQRSRKFLAAQEATVLPPALDHHDDASAVAPSLQKMIDGASDIRLSRMQRDDSHADAARNIEQHGPGFLATTGNQIASLSGKLVEWGKGHPMRLAAAAAVFIAASGLLVQVMKRKTQRVTAVRQAAKQIKKRVKSGVRDAVDAVSSVVRSRGRRQSKPRLALAGASSRSSKSR